MQTLQVLKTCKVFTNPQSKNHYSKITPRPCCGQHFKAAPGLPKREMSRQKKYYGKSYNGNIQLLKPVSQIQIQRQSKTRKN